MVLVIPQAGLLDGTNFVKLLFSYLSISKHNICPKSFSWYMVHLGRCFRYLDIVAIPVYQIFGPAV